MQAGAATGARLAEYDRLVTASFIMRDLYRTRNMRLAFKAGFYARGLKAGLMTLTGGRFPGRRIGVEPDAAIARRPTATASFVPDCQVTFSNGDRGFKSRKAPPG